MKTQTILFTLEELWLIRGVVRHEIPGHDQWHLPPANYKLNQQVAESIALCTLYKQQEWALFLDEAELVVLDATIPQDAKNADGVAIGKQILVKVCLARLEEEYETAADEDFDTKVKRLATWRKKHAKPDDNPDGHPDNQPVADTVAGAPHEPGGDLPPAAP